MHDQADETNDRGASKGMLHENALRLPTSDSRCGGKDDCDANKEQKRGKNQVGRSTPVPGGMLQWSIGKPFASVVIHQNHEGDGQSSYDIEKDQPLSGLRHDLLRADLR